MTENTVDNYYHRAKRHRPPQAVQNLLDLHGLAVRVPMGSSEYVRGARVPGRWEVYKPLPHIPGGQGRRLRAGTLVTVLVSAPLEEWVRIATGISDGTIRPPLFMDFETYSSDLRPWQAPSDSYKKLTEKLRCDLDRLTGLPSATLSGFPGARYMK